ncbi:hypothetical protein [Acinetobacter proteolyticus]|uniref:HNH endonuclease 5 domain-containing protein n=1 Tax=Acinetobacter proteolyticus TaxID=1776741 RepID=A0A2N0WBN2_9GAMM|nr:hypothetical protein [Acinetobacter proteolyticus]PKF31909.1 hypothetical protein CW311_16880 [Acinetobacter proteolyticus]
MICIYCGNESNGQDRTKEHVIPQWLIKKLGIEKQKCQFSPVSKYLEEFPITSPVPNTLVHKVCQTCNNGWLNEIDNSCKELLIKMITKDEYSHLLNTNNIQILQTLIFKIFLNFLATGPESFKNVRLEYFKEFYNYKYPPNGTELYISNILPREKFCISHLDHWQYFDKEIHESINETFKLNKTLSFKFFLQLGKISFVLSHSGADANIIYNPNMLTPLKIKGTTKPHAMRIEKCISPVDSTIANIILYNSLKISVLNTRYSLLFYTN